MILVVKYNQHEKLVSGTKMFLILTKGNQPLENNTSKLFVFAVLIVYVLVTTAVLKSVSAYLVTLNLNPWVHLAVSTGLLIVLGLGLIAVNKYAKDWIARRMD